MISQVLDTEQRKGFVRVAFASSDSKTINDHFGWAKNFLIYDVSGSKCYKVGKVMFSEAAEKEVCNPENKHFEKINALKSCHIVYSQSIGGPAAARLTQQKIHPMIARDTTDIDTVLGDLKRLLNGPVPPWMRKITGMQDPNRFDAYVNE